MQRGPIRWFALMVLMMPVARAGAAPGSVEDGDNAPAVPPSARCFSIEGVPDHAEPILTLDVDGVWMRVIAKDVQEFGIRIEDVPEDGAAVLCVDDDGVWMRVIAEDVLEF